MRFFALVLALFALTETAAALPINNVVAIQQAEIQSLKKKLHDQEVIIGGSNGAINRLQELAPKVLVNKSLDNCEFDFGGEFLRRHSQIRVTVGIFSVQPSSAVYIINRDDGGQLGFLQTGNNSPGNNNGNIWQSGTRIGARVGGNGASCTITMERLF